MLHAIGSAVSYLWGSDPQGQDQGDVDPHPGAKGGTDPSILSSNGDYVADSEHFLSVQKKLDIADPKNHKELTGKVTGIHSGYGLIDDHIYFEYSCVVGGVRPRVGDNVTLKAIEDKESQSWKAVQVSIISEWEEQHTSTTLPLISYDSHVTSDPDKTTVRAMVGMVTSTSRDRGIIDGQVPFLFSSTVQGYTPLRGDWVSCEVHTDNVTLDIQAFNVHPQRQQDYEGQVTDIRSGYGFIDRKIYFNLRSAINGYQPHVGDTVTGLALESHQINGVQWRALTMVFRQSFNDSFNKGNLCVNSPSKSNFIAELLANKQEVFVTEKLDFGILHLNEKRCTNALIRNTGAKPCVIKGCAIKSTTNQQFSVDQIQVITVSKAITQGSNIPVAPSTNEVVLQPNMTAFVKIVCDARYPGQDRQLLVIEFDDFKIGRHVSVHVEDPKTEQLGAMTPFQRKKNFSKYKMTLQMEEQCVVPGQRPLMQRKTSVALPNRLSKYPVPNDLRQYVVDGRDLVNVFGVLGQELAYCNFIERFKILLNLEEIQCEINIRQYDMQQVTLRLCGPYLGLTVPGVSEGQPSVSTGDQIVLTQPGGSDCGPQYEAYVHEVRGEELMLKFNDDFHDSYADEEYDIQFTVNRISLRRCHQGVQFAGKLPNNVIFPKVLETKLPYVQHGGFVLPKNSKLPKQSSVKLKGLSLFNDKLNTEQCSAVSRILHGVCRPTPYILYGPPGTGKTVTVVEAILQIFTHIPSSRILACTPSNSAADLIAQRLLESSGKVKSNLVRLNAFRRIEENVPADVVPYSMTGDDLHRVARYRLIICTCSTAGLFYTLGLQPGHFTHLFVDEAGQATEPECLVPVGLVACSGGPTVLAGDPKQLGPVLMSKLAIQYGLQYSFLERLMDSPLYARDEEKYVDHGCYDPLLVTKLVKNYRSHGALLHLSSQLFYHDELRECADTAITYALCNLDILPNKKIPLIFHGMRGEDMRESSCPSWFNPVEAVQVMRYLQAIVNNTHHKLTFDDIGIITPYRKQVEKIRQLISGLGMDKVKVGSVEEFQGQERPVIIVSMVRSSESLLNVDITHNLGFLSNPKRFNVTITRAQSLLIVIGNPHTLIRDYFWRSLLEYSIEKSAYIGCDLPLELNTQINLVDIKSSTNKESQTDVPKELMCQTDMNKLGKPGHLLKTVQCDLKALTITQSDSDVIVESNSEEDEN